MESFPDETTGLLTATSNIDSKCQGSSPSVEDEQAGEAPKISKDEDWNGDMEETAHGLGLLGARTFTGATTLSDAEALGIEEKPEVLESEVNSGESVSSFSSHERLGVLPMAVIVFYNVSGGPFGIEMSVRAGGNLFALLGFLIMPLLWSLPEALMTAELGTAFPEASGGVAWVEEAFGPKLGWMSGWLGWIAGATDNAIYPVLFLDYILSAVQLHQDDINPAFRLVFLTTLSTLLAYINWHGLPVVGKMSTWICLVAMSPFVVLILLGSPKVEPERWLYLPGGDSGGADGEISGGFFPNSTWGGIVWRPFLNNLFWNLNSFDAAGCFAAEMENPGRQFPPAMFLSVVMVGMGYFVPLLIAVGATDFERREWTDGFLSRVAGDVGGPWLGAWTVFAAAISSVALFQAELSADAFKLMGMADRGHLPNVFSRRSKHGTPTNGILLGLAVIIVMGVSDFEQLLEMLNFNYAIVLLMEYAAFLKLRISQPDLARPFKIPLNTLGCAILFSPAILVTLFLLGLATYQTYLFIVCANVLGYFMGGYAKRWSMVGYDIS